MAIERKGNDTSQKGNGKMTADYGQRAASALDRCIPGPHRDKEVARLFGVSVRFAKYLRRGQHWTTDRLTQASAALRNFDRALLSDERHLSEMQDIAERLARLESRFEDLHQSDSQGAANLSPARGEAADGIGGTSATGAAGEPDRAGPPARGEGQILARTGREVA